MLKTYTVISLDDETLKTNTGCDSPSLSPTLYDDSLKDTVIAAKSYNFHIKGTHSYILVSYVYIYTLVLNYICEIKV